MIAAQAGTSRASPPTPDAELSFKDLPVAMFSADRKYRYLLVRRVGFGERSILFVMLNPSKADENRNDNTVSRVIDYANRWGFGWLAVGNLSPFRSTDPKTMLAEGDEPEEVREENLRVITRMARLVDVVVIAWGFHAKAESREERTLSALRGTGVDLYCLGTTKDGHPLHPLYLNKMLALQPYTGD